ncbi:MAG: DUF192 domain-containing protein [Myxococcaceae bacterium]
MRMRTVMAASVALLLAGACETSAKAKDAGVSTPPEKPVITDVTHKDYVGPPLPKASVLLHDAFGGSHAVDVEVAATAKSRQRGLMWRTELKDGAGMLFIFPGEEVESFWMRNTLIPLDMLFINHTGKVVGIVENAEPKTLTSRSAGQPGKYVLEVPGGYCARMGIKPGSVAEIRGTQMIPVED